ncbi:hypothetical protein ABPG72_019295 [Tetrahymena utriculariae]
MRQLKMANVIDVMKVHVLQVQQLKVQINQFVLLENVKLINLVILGYDRDGCYDCENGAQSLKNSKYCCFLKCDYGTYSETGYYDDCSGDDFCSQCPIDKSTSQDTTKGGNDSVYDVQLKQCPKGKVSNTDYDNDGNGRGYQDCRSGTYSEIRSKYCNLSVCGYGYFCKTGYYDDFGENTCQKCPEGKTTLQQNAKGDDDTVCLLISHLIKCPEGKWSHTGFDSIGNRDGCYNCQIGTYSLEGSTACNLIECDIGFYSKTGYYDTNDFNSRCQKFPVGKTTLQYNTKGDSDSVCVMMSQLIKCPEGMSSPSGYDCIGKRDGCDDCEIGTSSKVGSKYCNLLRYGYYSTTGYYNADKYYDYKKCPDGLTTLEQNTKGDTDSVYIQLSKCPEGKQSPSGYDSIGNGDGCYGCENGTYSLEDSLACNLTPRGYGFYSETGYYDSDIYGSYCKECPKGLTTLKQNTIGYTGSDCILLAKCPEGKLSPSSYDSIGNGDGCNDCDIGTYSLEGSNACSLIPCGQRFYSETGYYDSDDNENKQYTDSVCILLGKCLEGKWSPTGYYSTENRDGCSDCDIGTYSLEGSIRCNIIPCDKDFYSETGFYHSSTEIKCETCPVNTTTDEIQTKSLDSSVCKNKPSDNTTSSIIIQITLSFILLVTIF